MDVAHLKGKFKGKMFHAVAMDGNNQIFPIGYGIFKSESEESWTWFLEKLHECIGEVEDLTFITDRAASIAISIIKVFPDALHCVCGFHIVLNLVKNFNKNEKTKQLFWLLAKAYTTQDFDYQWDRFCRVRPEEAKYLNDIPREQWSRAYCPRVRYDFLTSNYAESMNALSREARKQPVTPLIEFFRGSLQKWFYDRHIVGGISIYVIYIVN